jgi:hypothetical protein
MALPASGAISLNQVNVELGNAGTASINMGSAAVRGLFGVASGAIRLSDGYGKELPEYITATGGTITTSGDYKIHTFTGSSTFTISVLGNSAGSNTVEYLTIAGGGGGGVRGGGGGGAGGYRTATGFAVSVQSYSITVGAGGAAKQQNPGNVSRQGNVGSNSVFSSITSNGGGGGGAYGGINATSGGSGGGAGDFRGGSVKGTATAGQGYDGGQTNQLVGGGGGGGAGGVGQPNKLTGGYSGGDGGIGLASSINGTSITRAGGGGGCGGFYNASSVVGLGGSGGGGNGGGNQLTGTAFNGTINTGSGGGGYVNNSDVYVASHYSGSGGSGLVIIRYKFQ